jgi:hypothetical protein
MKKKGAKTSIHQLWIVQAYQHGSIDECEAAAAYATEAEAMQHARDFASEVPWNSYEHECVVFKAVATFRGKVRVTKFDNPTALPSADRS